MRERGVGRRTREKEKTERERERERDKEREREILLFRYRYSLVFVLNDYKISLPKFIFEKKNATHLKKCLLLVLYNQYLTEPVWYEDNGDNDDNNNHCEMSKVVT